MKSLIPNRCFGSFLEVYCIIEELQEYQMELYLYQLQEFGFFSDDYNFIWLLNTINTISRSKKDTMFIIDMVPIIITLVDENIKDIYLNHVYNYLLECEKYDINDVYLITRLYDKKIFDITAISVLIEKFKQNMESKKLKQHVLFSVLILTFGKYMDKNCLNNYENIIQSFEIEVKSFYYQLINCFDTNMIKYKNFN